jgi:hypothetical protein
MGDLGFFGRHPIPMSPGGSAPHSSFAYTIIFRLDSL